MGRRALPRPACRGTGYAGETTASSSVRPRGGRRALRIALFVLLAALGAATTASLFGAKGYRWRAFTLRLSVEPRFSGGGGGGETRLVFTPVGEVRARTHAPPVVFNIGLEKVAFEEVQRLVARTPPRRELEREFRAVAHRTAWDFSRRLLGLGALGALLAPVLLRARSARGWIAAPLLGASFMGIVLALTFWTYRPEAFRRPTYTGSLRQAPWAISLVTGAVSNTEALGARLRNVASGVQALYGRINTAGAVAGFAGPDARRRSGCSTSPTCTTTRRRSRSCATWPGASTWPRSSTPAI
jgi:hypothetical protein